MDDPAAEFLSREKEILGGLESEIVSNNDEITSEPLSSSDDFVMINNDENEGSSEESFAGMKISSNIPNDQREVPEKIRIWQENQVKQLEQKDKNELESIEQLRQEGKEELSKWHQNNKNNLEKIKKSNRKDEESALNGDDVVNDDKVWESIYKLCEFSHQKIKTGRDTSRMKSIFLQMKQNPLNKTT